jgi:hypothetical protein
MADFMQKNNQKASNHPHLLHHHSPSLFFIVFLQIFEYNGSAIGKLKIYMAIHYSNLSNLKITVPFFHLIDVHSPSLLFSLLSLPLLSLPFHSGYGWQRMCSNRQ